MHNQQKQRFGFLKRPASRRASRMISIAIVTAAAAAGILPDRTAG